MLFWASGRGDLPVLMTSDSVKEIRTHAPNGNTRYRAPRALRQYDSPECYDPYRVSSLSPYFWFHSMFSLSFSFCRLFLTVGIKEFGGQSKYIYIYTRPREAVAQSKLWAGLGQGRLRGDVLSAWTIRRFAALRPSAKGEEGRELLRGVWGWGLHI